jgi:hypothetical protein
MEALKNKNVLGVNGLQPILQLINFKQQILYVSQRLKYCTGLS